MNKKSPFSIDSQSIPLPEKDLFWVPFFALFSREIQRFFKVIFQTLGTPVINTGLYLLIFGVSLGEQIRIGFDLPYLAFLIPGLVTMGVLRNAFDNSSGSIITSKFCGELEDLRISPLSPSQIAWANGLGGLCRGLIVGLITLLIGQIFYYFYIGSFLSIQNPLSLCFFLFTSGLSFANLGLCIAMRAKTLEHVSAISTFVLLPFIYLGGIFFSLDLLHPFWRQVSLANPLLYLVNGVRYGILGISDIDILSCSIVATLSTIIFHLLALSSLKKGSYHRW